LAQIPISLRLGKELTVQFVGVVPGSQSAL
jgi:hypothetical protein